MFLIPLSIIIIATICKFSKLNGTFYDILFDVSKTLLIVFLVLFISIGACTIMLYNT
jgi:uncharacterized membrane protein